ncbi:hypothetical protein ACFYZH_09985 [Streptomyces abikoensis]|uniref:hypothetical protein n=1 Tax=Streptomyces abikoensis TaxID=97398 RepID=UPI003683A9DD
MTAAVLNTRIFDPHRQLSNPARITAAGLSKISNVNDDGAYRFLRWDTSDEFGGWVTNDFQAFAAPASGYYFLTANFTALSPKDTSNRPALRFVAVSQTPQGEVELLRSYNSTIVPNTYITCQLRGLVYLDKGNKLALKANVPAGTGPWEVSPGSRNSSQLNSFGAILISPNANRP